MSKRADDLLARLEGYNAQQLRRLLVEQVGYERVREIENPELASARALYQEKGYPKDWIEKRVRSIAMCGEEAIDRAIRSRTLAVRRAWRVMAA